MTYMDKSFQTGLHQYKALCDIDCFSLVFIMCSLFIVFVVVVIIICLFLKHFHKI